MRILSILAGPFLTVTGVALVVLWWFGTYTIDEGERGVLLYNGAVVGVAEPGRGFQNPFFGAVRRISLQDVTRRYEKVPVYSRDQQTAELTISVTYVVPAGGVTDLYSTYKSVENMEARLIDRNISEPAEIVFGQFNAIAAVQERARLSAEVSAAITKAIKGPVNIKSVQVENIDFSATYETSIEQRMQAEVEVQRLQQNAAREKVQAEITVTKAKADADSAKAKADAESYATLVNAQAQAKAVGLAGQAEADAMAAKGKALRENAGLIELTTVQRWNGQLPATMVPNATLPFLPIK
ncbi:regulator of protease activity HflC (stomatin/prohibitin superfamily) [Peteryoungia aggregata LMG 23059]|uniref:Regulator of protease activity HflC (Stomatin/prohibitin superfamily) n=1 Tax=Peteryoungia aggregata LMG 23059 TaxID=1368425 RepID=A0ABU0GAI3_9HYPH|nr:prohibitin family protein [Peteryoungia aggregata]MDQ0422366.1 regulator of protease activity HflC (stomatin/prohibitin superfamily) [Peteryoungia aggregata LMG 23059]